MRRPDPAVPHGPGSRARRAFRDAVLCLIGALLASPAAAESITGVCPDGSIFIVQKRSAIPCRRAKRVEPGEMPPMRPEYLPRPYTWEVYRQNENPNNPYNLLEAAEQMRELGGFPQSLRAPQAAPTPQAGPATAPPAVATTPVAPRGFSAGAGEPAGASAADTWQLALSDGELRDLFLIVEFAQEQVPARFVERQRAGQPGLEVSFAHSFAFDQRIEETSNSFEPRRALLFSVIARGPERFDPNLTLVQGHLSFQPRAGDPEQLGVLMGEMGPIGDEDVILGYLVLPPQMDLSEPIDLYWNDRQLTATFLP